MQSWGARAEQNSVPQGRLIMHSHVINVVHVVFSTKERRRLLKPEWQEGYGAFTIGVSQVQNTIRYIANQTEHHRRQDSEQESAAFLRKHGIDPS
jgi:hypothetical protein